MQQSDNKRDALLLITITRPNYLTTEIARASKVAAIGFNIVSLHTPTWDLLLLIFLSCHTRTRTELISPAFYIAQVTISHRLPIIPIFLLFVSSFTVSESLNLPKRSDR